jgi:hypothetical protein
VEMLRKKMRHPLVQLKMGRLRVRILSQGRALDKLAQGGHGRGEGKGRGRERGGARAGRARGREK